MAAVVAAVLSPMEVMVVSSYYCIYASIIVSIFLVHFVWPVVDLYPIFADLFLSFDYIPFPFVCVATVFCFYTSWIDFFGYYEIPADMHRLWKQQLCQRKVP